MEYDIIGDIHGHSGPLVRLLADLGYVERAGAFRSPDPNRMAVFLGDIIDRGPDQLGSIDIVRRMMDAGTALCLMGNHEHAAIGWLLPDPLNPGEFMRVHSDKNFRQHRVFLGEIGSDASLKNELSRWMESLPIYLDLPGIRCVHACWQPDVIDDIRRLSHGTGLLAGQVLFDSYRNGHETRDLIDTAIRGREVELPEGVSFVDSDGVERDKSRVRWWGGETPEKLRDLIVDDIETDADIDATSIFVNLDDPDPRPVFFGHYWMQGSPRLMTHKAACLDFSVAAGGELCAYSWRGEPVLNPDNLSWVSNRLQVQHGVKFG
ncbi:metallophosphoesterase [Rhizobium laguerreae]|uniref:metallophosphoesterase n=1 Tax=Rhizobium laguerreae TaxID=1076926 RepID=UPI001C9087CB|nr:metallophosphoesterase [Rhizobium laguerreae]MBY3157176.1 metallophosphoesterase [Rhizobium laguerreae]